MSNNNNYPNGDFGSNDLPDYNAYTGGNSGDSNPYEQTGYGAEQNSYGAEQGGYGAEQGGYGAEQGGYGAGNYGAGDPNAYGAPAFPNAAANNGAMFGNDRPGAWKRLLALIIDSLLVQVVIGGILLFVICGQDLVDWYDALKTASSPEEANELYPSGKVAIWGLIMLVIWLTYRVLMESKKGATLGKMAIGARVTSTDGQNLTPVESLKRNGWYIIGTVLGLIPLVGSYLALAFYIVVGVTIGQSPEKQSFTDKFANAYVVDKSAYYGVN
ncbi:RDD family protein [Corynebacterium jeikeium]|uniref:RDD family protein n=1 Tax=Corynebacterium jeikeium TaxID=38289 RepID=UPI0003014375|nr:RDD family protein [Corynebacterium jeikeium]WCZ54206.1 RDD family protein [Corynebacterium jeikeium]SQI20292.1 RDD family [Corynebacterium jeikeium]SUY80488.1 RDD family [Corynebacterium jeikeium]